jgi:hypothetical protein
MTNIIRETDLKNPVVHFDCNLIAAAKVASLKLMFLIIRLRINQRTKCDRRLQKLQDLGNMACSFAFEFKFKS